MKSLSELVSRSTETMAVFAERKIAKIAAETMTEAATCTLKWLVKKIAARRTARGRSASLFPLGRDRTSQVKSAQGSSACGSAASTSASR